MVQMFAVIVAIMVFYVALIAMDSGVLVIYNSYQDNIIVAKPILPNLI